MVASQLAGSLGGVWEGDGLGDDDGIWPGDGARLASGGDRDATIDSGCPEPDEVEVGWLENPTN